MGNDRQGRGGGGGGGGFGGGGDDVNSILSTYLLSTAACQGLFVQKISLKKHKKNGQELNKHHMRLLLKNPGRTFLQIQTDINLNKVHLCVTYAYSRDNCISFYALKTPMLQMNAPYLGLIESVINSYLPWLVPFFRFSFQHFLKTTLLRLGVYLYRIFDLTRILRQVTTKYVCFPTNVTYILQDSLFL